LFVLDRPNVLSHNLVRGGGATILSCGPIARLVGRRARIVAAPLDTYRPLPCLRGEDGSGSPGFACGAEARNASRPSRAEASSRRRAETVRAAVASRRSRAGPNGTAESRRGAPSGSPDFACGAEARNAGRPSRAEPVRAAAEFRRSGAGPNGTAARRAAAARGSPVAYGAKARNAGPFGSQQHPVDAGSWGWAVEHMKALSRSSIGRRHQPDDARFDASTGESRSN
jgi:hypothetical protein